MNSMSMSTYMMMTFSTPSIVIKMSKKKNPCCDVCIMIILIQWAQLLAVRISLLLNTTLHLGMQ
uniref:Uncharacterized protein n=1 Tax=Triticum urartu TaxID=4572 RepID=A0A8R7QZ00_TRIUA